MVTGGHTMLTLWQHIHALNALAVVLHETMAAGSVGRCHHGGGRGVASKRLIAWNPEATGTCAEREKKRREKKRRAAKMRKGQKKERKRGRGDRTDSTEVAAPRGDAGRITSIGLVSSHLFLSSVALSFVVVQTEGGGKERLNLSVGVVFAWWRGFYY